MDPVSLHLCSKISIYFGNPEIGGEWVKISRLASAVKKKSLFFLKSLELVKKNSVLSQHAFALIAMQCFQPRPRNTKKTGRDQNTKKKLSI